MNNNCNGICNCFCENNSYSICAVTVILVLCRQKVLSVIYAYNCLCFIVDISHIDKLYKTNSIAHQSSHRNECFPTLISFVRRNRTVHDAAIYRRHPKSFHLFDLLVFVFDYVEIMVLFAHLLLTPL